MKKLMKLMIAGAVMAVAGMSLAEPYPYEGAVDVTASRTTYTNFVSFGDTLFKSIEKLTFRNASAVTATNVVAMEDVGVWTTIGTVVVAAAATDVSYPVRSYTASTWAGYVVTGNVQVASTATTTGYTPYLAKKLRIITTLGGTNGNAVADAIPFSVYSK